MRKLLIILAIIAPLFSIAQLSVNMVSHISTSYKELKINNTQMLALRSDSITLDIYDISIQMQPQLIGSKILAAPSSNMSLMDNYLVVTEAQKLVVYDLNNANFPLISAFPITGAIKSLSISKQFAFVTLQATDGNYALWYINLTNPAAPALKSYIVFYNSVSPMTVEGGNGFLAEYQPTQTLVFIFDLNAASLHVRSMKYLPTSTTFMTKGNNSYLYDNQKVYFYTWTQTGQLSLVNSVVDKDILGISAIANGKCIALKNNALTVYELKNGEVYNEVFALSNDVTSIMNTDDYVFCATGTDLYVFEVQATATANIAPTHTTLNVYPNPAKESWKIDASTLERGDYRFELHDMLGKMVYAETLAGGEIWKIEHTFEAGTYFYTIEKEGVSLINGKLIGL